MATLLLTHSCRGVFEGRNKRSVLLPSVRPAVLVDNGDHLNFDQLFGFSQFQHRDICRRRLVVERSEIRVDHRARLANVADPRSRPEHEVVHNVLE